MWTGFILNPAPCLGVWLAVLCGTLLSFHKSCAMTTNFLSKSLPYSEKKETPESVLAASPSSTFRDNHYTEIAILLFLCLGYFIFKLTTHVLITSLKSCIALNEYPTIYFSTVAGLDPAGVTAHNTAKHLRLVVCSYAWESSFKA